MLWRLWNWVPVLFGLKMAGISEVAAAQNVAAGERIASIATPELTGSRETNAIKSKNRRTASGTIVTRLMTSSDMMPMLVESFIFADDAVVAHSIIKTAPAITRKPFVARPVSVSPQRPAARLAAAKAARGPQVRYRPGQVKQSNRPAARAKLKASGKAVAKRVAWMAPRTTAVPAGSNVLPFPAPKKSIPTALRSAA